MAGLSDLTDVRPVVTDLGKELREAAAAFVPEIRSKALDMERVRRLDSSLVERMDEAGLFSIFVPKRYGGAGLGPRELNEVLEVIGSADLSTAWVLSFYVLHNWLLCRFPRATQEELFDGRSSVRCAAVWAPPGKIERVPGGYRVNGRWGYASGAPDAAVVLVPGLLDGDMWWFIVPRASLQIIDDWDMGSMCATGSLTVAADDVFVREGWGMPVSDLVSATRHGGTHHVEPLYRYPFGVSAMSGASMSLGALERALELTREKLATSRPGGLARLERATSRMRWIEAYQTARVARFVRDAAMSEILEQADDGGAKTLKDEASPGMHSIWLGQSIREALRSLMDGFGTSSYAAADQVRRMSGDVAMLTTHGLGGDYDVIMERHARWTLGLGPGPGDPPTRLT